MWWRGGRELGGSHDGVVRERGEVEKNSLAKETAELRVFSPSFLYTHTPTYNIYIFNFAFSSVLAGLFIYRRHCLTFHAHGVSAILKTGRSPIGVSRIPRAATVHRRRRAARLSNILCLAVLRARHRARHSTRRHSFSRHVSPPPEPPPPPPQPPPSPPPSSVMCIAYR